MKLSERIINHLKSKPNKMDSDWGIMYSLYPDAVAGDKANGGRIAAIRKEARKDKGFHILSNDTDMIALD